MKLRYYICALEHLYVLIGLFWHLQIIFYITGHILDSLKSTFITNLKEWWKLRPRFCSWCKWHHRIHNISWRSLTRDWRILIALVASFNQYGFMRGRKPRPSILELLEFSAPLKINLHFQSCSALVRLKMLLDYSAVFWHQQVSWIWQVGKEIFKKNGEHCKSGSVIKFIRI